MTALIGSLPYTLVNGTTADANAVQANFNYIVSQVNANVQAAINAAVLTALPVGVIVEWSGSLASIPAPWQICDGTNGTPNLKDKFIVGAGNTYAVGATGGEAVSTITVAGTVLSLTQIPAHSHTLTDPGHTHSVSDPTHTHGVNDPTHSHTWPSAVTTGGTTGVYEGPDSGGTGGPTDASSTGISINNASTGISNNTATTGITAQNAGGGGSHTHTATQDTNLPPYYALAYIMKLS